jgi:tripartite-type tricarboxylate transporter receptor subunit TctC
MPIQRLLFAAAALALAIFAGAAQSQTVRVLVGYPPGGGVDQLGRIFAERLSEGLGKPVVVENRAGASGQIATQALKAAAPDGMTLMICPDAIMVLSPHTVAQPLPYNTLTDFAAVAHVGSFEYGLAVGAGIPAKSLQEWIAFAKANPKNATYGTSGVGTGPQFVGTLIAQATGVPLTVVPYRGVAPAITDLLGGQLPSVVLPYGQMTPLARAGKIRILAHSGSQRTAFAPDIPTFKELGYPSVDLTGWYGMFAPAGTPPDVIARYNEIVNQSLRTPAMRDQLRALDLGIREMSPAELTALVKKDFEKWRGIVKASGYKAE